MRFTRLLLLFAVLDGCGALAPLRAAPTYQLTDLGVSGNYAGSQAVAVANSGNLVAGNLIDNVGLLHAFVYAKGNQTILPVPDGYVRAQAVAMNNNGEIVGNLIAGNNSVHAFAYYNGTTHDLGTLQQFGRSFGGAVNDSGAVVGISAVSSPQSTTVACIFPSTNLKVKAGYFASAAYSINSSGQVVVGEQGANGVNLFLYANGNLTSLSIAGITPNTSTRVYVNNNAGQIIGTLLTNHHPFLAYQGKVTDLSGVLGPTAQLIGLNNPGALVGTNQNQAFVYLGGTCFFLAQTAISGGSGWAYITATAINDSGQIVGTGVNPLDHLQHAYLLTLTNSGYPPVITTQPASATIKVNLSATFKIVVKTLLAVTPQYRWQRLPAGTAFWTSISNNSTYAGVTTATLTVSHAALNTSGDQFRCVITNNGGTATSNAATLLVEAAPSIYQQPIGTEVTVGTQASFTVGAKGQPTPTYQWQRLPAGSKKWANVVNNSVYSGATASALYVSNPTLAMSGDQFKCIVKNKLGSVTTTVAKLEVVTIITP